MKIHRSADRAMPCAGRRRLLGAAAAALLAAPAGWPRRARAATPIPTELRWTDAARNRTLPLLLRLPAGDAPCAVILHSHGLGGSRSGGAAWGQAWCDAGFAVLHLQHPGSDTEVFRGGASALRAAASGEQLINRAGDVRFVIDELERQQRSADAKSAPWRRLRLDALGLSGHSFGAMTTLAAAGQRYSAPGDLSDPRPRAFIAFSPSPGPAGRGAMPLAQQFGAITRPCLVMTGSLDADPLDGGRDPTRRDGHYRASVYDGLPNRQQNGQRALLWLDGADHMTFGGGRPGEGDRDGRFLNRFVSMKRERAASEGEAHHHALIQRTSLLWWHAHLLGDADAAAALRGAAAREGLAAADRWTID